MDQKLSVAEITQSVSWALTGDKHRHRLPS